MNINILLSGKLNLQTRKMGSILSVRVVSAALLSHPTLAINLMIPFIFIIPQTTKDDQI